MIEYVVVWDYSLLSVHVMSATDLLPTFPGEPACQM